MQKNTFFLILIFLYCGFLKAQVGVNTASPQGVFHVDAKNDTSGLSNTSDDLVITNEGNMGIGTISPSEKLHVLGESLKTGNSEVEGTTFIRGNGLIKGSVMVNGDPLDVPDATLHVKSTTNSMKIESPDYEPGKFITTDADGNATWEKLLAESVVRGLGVPMFTTAISINTSTTSPTYTNITNTPLVLSKGVWLVIARYGTRSTGTAATQVTNPVWTKLQVDSGGKNVWTDVVTNATVAEVGTTGVAAASRYKTAIPQLTHILNVTEDNTAIRILSYLPYAAAYVTVPSTDTNAYMPGFMPVFIAIRLNDKSL